MVTKQSTLAGMQENVTPAVGEIYKGNLNCTKEDAWHLTNAAEKYINQDTT
jgi:hypothetical protein